MWPVESESLPAGAHDVIHAISSNGFSARSFHTRASPWCKSAQRPQKVGLICVKYTPAGAERKRALPLSRSPPVQILTPLAANPAPWERLCPLFFGIPSVRELSQVALWIKAPFQQGETYKFQKKSHFFSWRPWKVFVIRTCRCPAPPRASHPGSGLRRSSLCLGPPTYRGAQKKHRRQEYKDLFNIKNRVL